MPTDSKFLKHIIIVGSLDVLGTIQSLIFLPIVTKVLGAGDYGIWTQIKITTGLLVPFTFLGLHEALVRFLPGEKEKRRVQEGIYFSLVLVFGISLLIASLLFIFPETFSAFLKFDAIYIKFIALLVIFESANTIFFVIVRAFRKITQYFWFMVIKMMGEIVFAIFAILAGFGLYGAVFASLGIRIIVFAGLATYLIRQVGFKLPNFSLAKEYLGFGLPTMADHVSYWVITSIDRYFIGFMMGIVFVGYYAPAYSLGTLLTVFIFPLAFMLSVVLPKLYDENKIEEVKNYLKNSLKYYLLLSVPAFFGLSALSRQFLSIFSTQEISNNSYFVVPLITASMVLYGITYFFSEILVLDKNTKLIAFVWAVAAACNLFLNWIFIPYYGILAAGATTLFAYFIGLMLMGFFALKRIKFEIDWRFISKCLASSFVMGLIIILINPKGFFGVMLCVVGGVIVYLACLLMFRGIGKKEINFLKNSFYEMAIPSK